MAVNEKISSAVIFGGSGFLGSHIAKRLADNGIETKIAVRHPDSVSFTGTPEGGVKIQAVYADIRDETSVGLAISGCDAVINSVGLYFEQGAETFEAVHEIGALNVAHQAAQQKVKALVHISGIGADQYSQSRYVSARGKGELMVHDVFDDAVILRPSVLFGPEDQFINSLAGIIRATPIFPLFGRGETRLQPVFAGDVAEAVVAVLNNPASRGKTYELGGPETFTYREIVQLVMDRSGRRRVTMPVPFWVWNVMAAGVSFLPKPPISRDQVTLMKRDNVASPPALSFEDLDVPRTSLRDVLSEYEF